MGFRNNKKGFIEHLTYTYSEGYFIYNQSIQNLEKEELRKRPRIE